MSNRIRLSISDVTMECEGSDEFIRQALESLIPQAVILIKEIRQARPVNDSVGLDITARTTSSPPPERNLISTSFVAQKIKCSSGTELIKAAAIKLTLADTMQTFTRLQVLESMKTATAFYRETYSSNLSKYLNQLSRDGILNEVGAGLYALSSSALEDAKFVLGV